jgi:hypothetical protein
MKTHLSEIEVTPNRERGYDATVIATIGDESFTAVCCNAPSEAQAREMATLELTCFKRNEREAARARRHRSKALFQERPADRSADMNYAGGGYNRDSRGNYREAFYAGSE